MSTHDEAIRAWILASKNSTENHPELAALPLDLIVELHPEYKEYGPQPAKTQNLIEMMKSYQSAFESSGADRMAAKEAWGAFVNAAEKGLSIKTSYLGRVQAVKSHSGNYWRARWMITSGLSRSNQDSLRQVFVKTCEASGVWVAPSNTRDMVTIIYLSLADRTLGVNILPRTTITSIQSAYHKLHVAQRNW